MGSLDGIKGPLRKISAVAVVTIIGCGDDGRAVSESASATSGLTSSTTATATTAPTSGASETASSTAGPGSNSNSESQTTAGTTQAPTTSETEGTSTGAVSVTDTGSTGSTSTGGDPCSGEMGAFDFSYLWVANTDQGSISKVNTMTLIEEARYWSDPGMSGASNPSRTSVNIDGHFVVVSNRDSGYVTKVAANKDDCIDKNGNGMIDTSPNKDTLLAFADEECTIWSTKVTQPISGGAGPRATAWAPGEFNTETCTYDNQKLWIGWLTAPGQAVLGRLDGATGVVETTVPLPNWPVTADLTNGYAPYGAAADADGYIWTTAVFSGAAYRVDPNTLEVKVWTSPDGDSHYGMTVDQKGRPWFANYGGTHGGISVFDPQTETFTVVPNSGNNLYRGIAVDSNEQVWVANNGGTNPCGMMQVSGDSLTVVQFHTFPQCGTPVGMSIDVDGDVWLVDYNGWAYEIDPETYAKTLVTIPNVHYTYSDMTGGGLQNAIIPK